MISSDNKSGLEVQVRRVGGDAFAEYDVRHALDSGGHTAISSCWLESEIDAAFEIKISVSAEAQRRHGSPDLVAVIYVDGRLIHRQSMPRSNRDNDTTCSTMRFMESGSMFEGQLKFVALRTTDNDEEVTLGGAQLQSLGKIRVDIIRGKLGSIVDVPFNCLVNPDVGVAAEKGKKLGGGVGYTEKKPALPSTRSTNWAPVDLEARPYYRFDLNYRPRPILQLLGIVEQDAPRARIASPPAPQQPAAQAGPSRKRKVEVIDIDADEEETDVKPDNKKRMATRLNWLERQLQTANNLLKRRRVAAPADIVDLTGDD